MLAGENIGRRRRGVERNAPISVREIRIKERGKETERSTVLKRKSGNQTVEGLIKGPARNL